MVNAFSTPDNLAPKTAADQILIAMGAPQRVSSTPPTTWEGWIPPSNRTTPGTPRLNLPSFCVVGDSISNNSGSLDSVPTNNQISSMKNWAEVANAENGHRGYQIFPTANDPGYFGTTSPGASGNSSGAAFGVGGATTSMLLDYGYLRAAANSTAYCVILHIGTNDINSGMAGDVLANTIRGMWQTLTAAGKVVIGTTILPRDSSVITGAKLTALNLCNYLLRRYAAAEPHVYLCDWHAALLDVNGAAPSSGAASAWTTDGLHPNPAGAGRMGTALASVLNTVLPTGLLPTDHLFVDPAEAMTPNPLATGNTAGVATSWTLTTVGAPTTLTPTKVVRTDMIPGQWQQVFCTAATINSDGFSITLTDSTTSTWAVGDQVYAVCELQADATNWDCRGLQLDVVKSGSSQIASTWNISSAERLALTGTVIPAPSGNFVLVTPRVTLEASLTAVRAVLRFFGTCQSLRIGRMGVVKV